MPARNLHQNYAEFNVYKMETFNLLFFLFLYSFGPVHSVKLLSARRCAFVNYINKEDCERAIREMNVSVVVFYLFIRGGGVKNHLSQNKWSSVYSTQAMKLQKGLKGQ